MPEEFVEVLWIAEYPNKEAVVVASEDVFSEHSEEEKKKFINSLITLGLDKLSKDYTFLDEEESDLLIPLSEDEEHSQIITGYSFLLNEKNDFDMFMYFGGQVNPSTTLREGLSHAMKVLTTIKNS